MTTQHIGPVHVYRCDGISRRSALAVARKLTRTPPVPLGFTAYILAYVSG